jgi:chromosome segregation ATPase
VSNTLRPGASRDDTQPHARRDEQQIHSLQQQVDELRRQQRENLARLQWFEELYKQGEGRVAQLQLAQDRLAQDISQALHARQIDEGRTKGLLSELTLRVEAPEKQLRDLRALIGELSESRKNDRDTNSAYARQIEDLQRQIRELNAHISKVGDAQKGVRDLIAETQASIGEARQEAQHVGELQRVEEQRLRRQGVELQGMFESLRQQFTELAARSQRVDDVRRALTEQLESISAQLDPLRTEIDEVRKAVEELRTLTASQYLAQQDRVESIRTEIDSELAEMRQLSDQRTDRYTARFNDIDERLRDISQTLSEFPSRFEALERRDEVIGSETDTIEEWLVQRQLDALQGVLDDVRKRRAERAPNLTPSVAPKSPDEPPKPGSVYNPSGLIKSVRDARPPQASSGMRTEE